MRQGTCFRTFAGALIAVVLAVFCFTVRTVAADNAEHTRATMRQIFEALGTAFSLSVDGQQFDDPANRPRILDALRVLSENAAQLETHGDHLKQSFGFLRHSVARDARATLAKYEQGQPMESRFLLHRLTENCFACHSRLPGPREFELGEQFVENVNIKRLPLKERARLEVATRQFRSALETYEAMFRSPSIPAAQIALMGAFEDYLKLCIRVCADFTRPIATLEAFRRRPDVPRSLADYIESWVGSLKELRLQQLEGDDLARARALIRDGQRRNRFPADRLGLVHFVVASSILHQFEATGPASKSRLSEAYYLLGVVESYISRSFWISETEFFLESAIRVDPGSPSAKKSYALLEEYIIVGYRGSSTLDLPPDVQAQLEELHTLVEGQR